MAVLFSLMMPASTFSSPRFAESPLEISVTVRNEVLNPISNLLFGHFLERASFGEPGPEAVLADRASPVAIAVVERLGTMKIPLLRFPGGIDVDFMDWTNLVDLPGRIERPTSTGHRGDTITNRFGYHEFFAFSRELGAKTAIVLNLLDAAGERRPLREAVLHHAGLLAYTNAKLGQILPKGMPDWPALRALNGHPEPFGANFVQIGNESWKPTFHSIVSAARPRESNDEKAAWLVECYKEMIRTIREIDPKIAIIIDADPPFGARDRLYSDKYILQEVQFMARHQYGSSGSLTTMRLGKGLDLEASGQTDSNLWAWWTNLPGRDGGPVADTVPTQHPGLAHGLKFAYTEWNWNQWNYAKIEPKPRIRPEVASGLGAVRFLLTLMRAGDRVGLATQSMLVGTNWELAGVLVKPEEPSLLRISPQLTLVNEIARQAGAERLRVEPSAAGPALEIVAADGSIIQSCGQAVEILATRRSPNQLAIFVINRSLDKPVSFHVAFEGFESPPSKLMVAGLVGDPYAPPGAEGSFSTLAPKPMLSATASLERVGLYTITASW